MSRIVAAYSGYDPSTVKNLDVAIGLANTVTALDSFYTMITSRTEPFQLADTEATPARVAEILRTSTMPVRVNLAKTKWPFSRVTGWTPAGDPDDIFLNLRLIRRSPLSLANTIIHEWIHAVDNRYPMDFGHGGNRNRGGKMAESAPYWIASEAEKMMRPMLEAASRDLVARDAAVAIRYLDSDEVKSVQDVLRAEDEDPQDVFFIEGVTPDQVAEL